MKPYISNILLFCCLITLFLSSCDEEMENLNLEQGYDYFPLEIGQTLIYSVDSINFINGGATIDSTRTMVRETMTDTLSDNEGNILYKIERYTRKENNLPWQIEDVWTSSRDEERAFRTEENLRFVKLVFPLQENRIWESTAFIDNSLIVSVGGGETLEMFKGWESEILSVNQAEVIGDFEFDEVTTIVHANFENAIEYRYVIEKYAKNVGLVYKEMQILETQSVNAETPWREKAEEGFIMKQTISTF